MKRRKAFTIVELVIVIAVIAILAAVLIPTFSTVVRKAKDSYFLQNKRNEALEDFADSMLDEDYVTEVDEIVNISDDDAQINEIKKDLSDLFNYLLKNSQKMYTDPDGTQHIMLIGIGYDFFRKANGYSYVGSFGSGVLREIYSYADKYIILYNYIGDISSIEISLYDDVAIRNHPKIEGWTQMTQAEVYYKLKVVDDEENTTDSQNPKSKIQNTKLRL